MANDKELTKVVANVQARVRAAGKNAIKADAELKRLERAAGASEAGKLTALRKALDAILIAA